MEKPVGGVVAFANAGAAATSVPPPPVPAGKGKGPAVAEGEMMDVDDDDSDGDEVGPQPLNVKTSSSRQKVDERQYGGALLRGEGVPKGDALATARVAGILAAKRTSDLIPLCHQLALTGVDIAFEVGNDEVAITATVRSTDRTGVEMEALTSVAVAGLTVIDMVKAVDPRASITDVRLLAKSGGKSGEWRR